MYRFQFSMKATAQGMVKPRQVMNTPSAPNCNLSAGMVAPERTKLIGDTIIFVPVQKQNTFTQLLPVKTKINSEAVSTFIAINGIVLNENNDPVPFATVMIKG